MWYSIEPRTRKYIKRHGFLSFARKYKKQLLNTWLGASKKVVHEAGEFIGNKIGGAVNDGNVEKQEPVEQIIIPPKKKRWNIKQTEKSIMKMEHSRISKFMRDSTVSRFVTKNVLK